MRGIVVIPAEVPESSVPPAVWLGGLVTSDMPREAVETGSG